MYTARGSKRLGILANSKHEPGSFTVYSVHFFADDVVENVFPDFFVGEISVVWIVDLGMSADLVYELVHVYFHSCSRGSGECVLIIDAVVQPSSVRHYVPTMFAVDGQRMGTAAERAWVYTERRKCAKLRNCLQMRRTRLQHIGRTPRFYVRSYAHY